LTVELMHTGLVDADVREASAGQLADGVSYYRPTCGLSCDSGTWSATYSAEEVRDWLGRTGWRFLEQQPLAGPISVLVAEATSAG